MGAGIPTIQTWSSSDRFVTYTTRKEGKVRYSDFQVKDNHLTPASILITSSVKKQNSFEENNIFPLFLIIPLTQLLKDLSYF